MPAIVPRRLASNPLLFFLLFAVFALTICLTGDKFDLDLIIVFILVVLAAAGIFLFLWRQSSRYYRVMLENIKKSEDLLHESEHFIRTVISSVQEGLIVFDRESRCRIWNPFMEKLTGVSAEALIGKTVPDILPHLKDLGIDQLFNRALTGEIVHSPDMRISIPGTKKHGWAVATFGPHRSPDGAIIGVVGTVLDISDRKRAEASLAAEREHLTVTLRSIGDGVISTDNNGRIVLMNNVAETLTGWNMEEAVGKPLQDIFHIVNETSRVPCENPVEKVLANGSTVTLPNHMLLIDRNGRTRYIIDSCAPIKTAEGALIGAVVVFRDNTENQKSLDNMIKAEKLESIGILAGGIAHDFNNLLGGVFGYISLARDYVTGNDKAFTFLSKALNAFHRAGDLTKQLLTFSKGGTPVKKTFHLEPILREMAQFALSGSNVRCIFSISKNLPMCDIDKNQIGQVIDNIIINAKQAMPNGGEISIAAEKFCVAGDVAMPLAQGDYVRIAIKDQGTGIAKEHLSKIFDPFFTTKQKGTGLGLATSFSIIQRHDGFIDVETEVGKGSTFIIYLPVSKSPVSPEQQSESPEMKGKGRILIMDGEDFIREITREMLKVLGYETVLADSGDEALSLVKDSVAEQKPFDAVILDLTIAGSMGGMETAKVLRAIDPNIKAIVSSGYANDPVMADPTSYGFLEKLKKPFLKEDLAQVIYRVLCHAS